MNGQTISVQRSFGLDPMRIDAAEIWFRELSQRLKRHGCRSVLCFANQPSPSIRKFLEAPTVTFDALRDSWELKWRSTVELSSPCPATTNPTLCIVTTLGLSVCIRG